MKHAHAMEYIQKREVELTINKSRKSQRTHSATYRGTQVVKQLQGDKYEIPSLCEIYVNKTL